MTYKDASQIYSNYLHMKTRYLSIAREITKVYSSDNFPSDKISMSRENIMFMHDIITKYLDKLELEMNSDVQ